MKISVIFMNENSVDFMRLCFSVDLLGSHILLRAVDVTVGIES